jgi:hypothetical protein
MDFSRAQRMLGRKESNFPPALLPVMEEKHVTL